jgi:hypothetical protein
VILLLEPVRPPGFVSGGYRYQDEIGRRLEAQGLGRQEALAPEQLAARAAEARAAGDTVVVDGLFVGSAPAVPGCRLLLHMLPGEQALQPWLTACTAVIATGGGTAAAVAARGVPVAVIRPGLDACFTAGPEPAAGGKLRVLCVGTVARHKGQYEVVAALARDRELAARCTLECVGSCSQEPDYVAEMQLAAARAQLELELPGPLSAAGVAERLQRADLFVSASLSESFGMAVAEAAACAVPVLAFATGEIRSFVHNGANARLLTTDFTALEFAVTLHRLLYDDAARRALRRPDLRPHLGSWDEVARAFAAAMHGHVELAASPPTEFEAAVLAWLGRVYPYRVQEQLARARVSRREYTGVGCYSTLVLPPEMRAMPGDVFGRGPLSGPCFESPAVAEGGGTLLWFQDGRASRLEIYAHGNRFPRDHRELGPFRLFDVPVGNAQTQAPRTVPVDASQWSESNRRTLSYVMPPLEYVDRPYSCVRCAALAVYPAAAQRQALEVRKASMWQRRLLCPACWAERGVIAREIRACRRQWQAQPAHQPLRQDREFLARWLEWLEAWPLRGEKNTAIIRMLRRLLDRSVAG